jgi:DNA-binding transcriptional ArsR family regulator
MVQYSRSSLDVAFAALADPIRRDMLEKLARGETSVSRLAEPHDVSLTAIRKHLQVLERAGLVTHEKRGRVRHVRLASGRRRKRERTARLNFLPLREVKDWIAQFESHWDHHLQKLKLQVESDL